MYYILGLTLVLIAGVFSSYDFNYQDFLRCIETDSIFLFIILPMYLFKLDSDLKIFNDSFIHRYESRSRYFNIIKRQTRTRSFKFVLAMSASIVMSFILFFQSPDAMMLELTMLLVVKTFVLFNIVTYLFILLTRFFNKDAMVITYVCLLIEYYVCYTLILDTRMPLIISWYFYSSANQYLVVLILILFLVLMRSLSSTLFLRKDFI